MLRFTIREVLWLTVVVALAVSWWVDNKRIEQAVTKLGMDRRQLETDRRLMQADFQDKMTVLDDAQRKLRDERWGRILPKRKSPSDAGIVTSPSAHCAADAGNARAGYCKLRLWIMRTIVTLYSGSGCNYVPNRPDGCLHRSAGSWNMVRLDGLQTISVSRVDRSAPGVTRG